MKRLFDIVAILVVSPLALFLCSCCAIASFLAERQNPFFVQWRLGRNEKEFRMYKLRTMYASTPELASHDVSDSQVTRLGGLLRKYKLDEIPQLFNVLLGHMALVGPRPCLPIQKELIEARRTKGVFNVRPGITGLAQIRDIDMSDAEILANVDKEYLEGIGLIDDFKIIIATIFGRGRGDRVAKNDL